MKTKQLFFSILISVVLTSCAPVNYFQVYKATPSEKITLKENFLVYEDDNCKVSYNLWDDGGNIGFRLYNKTEQNIYLNLEESYFILNGISYDYFQNRIFTNSTNTGAAVSSGVTASKSMTGINYLNLTQTNRISATNSVGAIATSGYSVSYNENKIVCIPSKTSKVITEYSINKSLFRDCDLFKYPSQKQIKTKNFKKSESPFIFSNRISYIVGQSGSPVKFENEFYITEITNYPESDIIETKYDEYCGQKSMVETKYFKNISPDKFYIRYMKGLDTWKH